MRGPLFRHSYANRLPARVHARVGTASSLRHHTLPTEFGEHPLDFALNGPLLGLDLPASEFGPVIVQHELHSARRHRGENYSCASGWATGQTIDIASPSRSH